MGTVANLIIASFPYNQFVLPSMKVQIDIDPRCKIRSALKETKLVGRPEFELKWKLQNITINYYF